MKQNRDSRDTLNKSLTASAFTPSFLRKQEDVYPYPSFLRRQEPETFWIEVPAFAGTTE